MIIDGIGGIGGADLDDADYDDEDFYDDSVAFTIWSFFDGIGIGTGDDPLIFRTWPCSYSRTC